MASEMCAPDCAERTACPVVGEPGHWQCGTCPKHKEPRHHCGCLAAPSPVGTTEPPAIVRETIEDALENDRCGICGSVDHFREDCPEPPAETQQDDEHEFCCGPGEQFVQAVNELFFEVDPANTDPSDLVIALLPIVLAYGDARAALAARPSADTETLRRVRELADEYFGLATDWARPMDGASVMLRIRAALDAR